MADKPTGAKEKSAAQRVKDAQDALAAAQAELAESQGELQSTVTRSVPKMVVRVKPNAHVVHEGKSYTGAEYPGIHGDDHGNEVELDGPTAMALVMQGQVDILRSAGVKE